MRFDFELQICVFRSQKRMTLPESDDLGHQSFKSINGMLSKLKMLSMTANSSSRTIDELDGDKAV